MISRPFSLVGRRYAARDNPPQQHSASGIIPLLLCNTPPIFLSAHAFPPSRDALRITRATLGE
jgi:hypothetical protein